MILKARYFLCFPSAVVAVTWAMLATTLHGFTYSTPEQSSARVIASWVNSYSRSHGGGLPRSWQDLQNVVEVPVDDALRHTVPSRRYAFISPPLKLAAPLHGELVAINRRDIFDSTLSMSIIGFTRGVQGPGRYMIYRTKEGDFSVSWVAADYVRDFFDQARVALPVPDGEPEREWVKAARRAVLFWKALMWTVIAGLACSLWRFFRRETSWGMMLGFWYDDLRKRKHG